MREQRRGLLPVSVDNLPAHLRRRVVVRADFGFYAGELLGLWERFRVRLIVVARLAQPAQRLLRRETRRQPAGVEGTEAAELDYQDADVPATAQFIAIRHRIKDRRGRAGGKPPINCPGYLYQVLVTNLPRSVAPVDMWR